MRYWFDTEFIEDGKTIELISIGVVAENGAEFYRLNWDCDLERADAWVREHVWPQIPHKPGLFARGEERGDWRNHSQIGVELREFVGQAEKPEFWGYYADYDWVVLCQLFGKMIELPKGWPMYCRDIKQWADMLGNPRLPEQGKGEHHALADARWNRQAWEFLTRLQERTNATLTQASES